MTISWPAANLGAKTRFLSPSQADQSQVCWTPMHTGRSGGLGQATLEFPSLAGPWDLATLSTYSRGVSSIPRCWGCSSPLHRHRTQESAGG